MEPANLTVLSTEEEASTASLAQAFGDLHARLETLLTATSTQARRRALVDAADVAERAAQAADLTPATIQRITTAILQMAGVVPVPTPTPGTGTMGEVVGVGGGGCAPVPGIPGSPPPPTPALRAVPAKRTNHRWAGEALKAIGDPPRWCTRCPLEEHLEHAKRWGRVRVYRAAGRELGRIPGGSVPACPVKT